MISERSCWVLALSIVLSACALESRSEVPLSVDGLIKTEASVLGKTVTVRGYLRFGDDTRNLWSTRDAYATVTRHLENGEQAPNDPNWQRCVSLYEIGSWRDFLLGNDNKYVIVTGLVRRHPTGPGEISMGACSDLGIEITSVRSD